jgi:MYND finger
MTPTSAANNSAMVTNATLVGTMPIPTAPTTTTNDVRPVMGTPLPNSDVVFFINVEFQNEFEVCGKLSPEYEVVSFEADLVQKLHIPNTITYTTSLRVPKGCIARAKMHPTFRRLLVQSLWLQQQPAMLRYKGKDFPWDTTTPVCNCANPPCEKPAVRFVGNPGFFAQKNILVDPFCVPVCPDTACILQAQQMSQTIHAQAQAQQQVNPALIAQMPLSVRSCNTCGSFERAHGGSALVIAPCPLCGIANYCSRQCQMQDWQRGHKDVCTNAKGKTTVRKQAPATTTSISKPDTAPAPAPAPIPIQQPRVAPSPAPMPLPVQAPAPAPIPMPAPVPAAATAKKAPPATTGMPELTQAMSVMQLPTYNMAPAHTVSAPPYNIPQAFGQGSAPVYSGVTPVASKGSVPSSHQAALPEASTTTPSNLPIKTGRKKAE